MHSYPVALESIPWRMMMKDALRQWNSPRFRMGCSSHLVPPAAVFRDCAEEWGMTAEQAENNLGFDKD
jgi:hypothetical protein